MNSAQPEPKLHLATFELTVVVEDHPTARRRWNGGPMPSIEADAAFVQVLTEEGFQVARTSYGVRAEEASRAAS
jgi:hypothetical protein